MEIDELEREILSRYMQTMRSLGVDSKESERFKEFITSLLLQYKTELYNKEIDNKEYQECDNLMHSSLNAYRSTYDSIESININNKHYIENIHKIPITDIQIQLSHVHDQISHELELANKKIIELSQQISALEKSNNIDNLTKVYNRKAMKTFCNEVIVCAEKNSNDVDLFALYINIDSFKKINDTHGHLAGDKVLIFLGKTLKRIVREQNRIFRFGGDEFVIMLNRYSKENAKKSAERIRSTIEKSHLIYMGHRISITVSMGLSQYKTPDSVEDFIQRANEELRKAKSLGANTIVIGE